MGWNAMHNNQLNRVLGMTAVIAFGLTNEIAAGLFFVSTQIQISSPGVGNLVPLLMFVGGVITLITVIAYRYFFASGLVGAGGEYVIISRSLSPGLAFVATFLAWFGFTGALGTLAYAAPSFLATAAASLGAVALAKFLTSSVGILIVGLVILWGFWLIHVRGVRLAGMLVVIAMVLVLAVSLLMIIIGFSTTHAGFDAALQAHLHMSAQSIAAKAPVQHISYAVAFGKAIPLLFFGYLGLSTATQTGGEAKNAKRTLSRGVMVTVLTVTVVYTLFSVAVYHAVPWRVIAGLGHLNKSAYTTSSGLLQFVMPNWLSSLINLLVAMIVVKTFLPIYLAQSRWVYAWSEDGIIPKVFARTHAKYKTPVLALTLSALFGTLSLLESIKLGFVFGVSVRVLSVMIVFFFMGLGMIMFPKHAPNLYAANESSLAKKRGVQVTVGIFLMAVSVWFSVSIILSSLSDPFYLQPVVQALVVALIGWWIYAVYRSKLNKSQDPTRIQAVQDYFLEAPPQ